MALGASTRTGVTPLLRGKPRAGTRPDRRVAGSTATQLTAGLAGPPYAVYRLAVHLGKTGVGARFSSNHPDLRLEIQNRMEVGSGYLLIEGRILGPQAGVSTAEWEAELLDDPDVKELQFHSSGGGSVNWRVTQRAPPIHDMVRRHRLLTRYPLVLQGGWLRFETVATAAQIRALIGDMKKRIGPSRVEAIRRGTVELGSLGLGPAQEIVFRAAMAGGYFDLPRGISVTGLAERLGLSKSAVSEALTRIEKRLADAALQLSLV